MANPLVVVVLGLIAITEWQEDMRIKDIATVDIALLTDDVPPNAFADNGYMAYLKMKTVAKPEVEEKKRKTRKFSHEKSCALGICSDRVLSDSSFGYRSPRAKPQSKNSRE